MSDIIDFETAQNIRDTNPNLRIKDENGKLWFKFTCSYVYDGITWVLHFMALNKEDADARCEAIKTSLQVDGMICEEIPQ